jgi:hypothetical protein
MNVHIMVSFKMTKYYHLKKIYHFVDLVIMILKIYKCFRMDYVVKEISDLDVVKKRKKNMIYMK